MRLRHRTVTFFGSTLVLRALTDFIGLGGLRLGFGTAEESMLACLSAPSPSLEITSAVSIGGSLLMLEVEMSETLLPEE
jgi:histidinol-phosphate/aromatic aminotransferase/cobyric acid decarboxylase-like protein